MMDRKNTFFSLNINAFTHRIGILSGSAVLKFALQFIIIIVYAKNLSLVDYGIYQSVWLFINFFSVIGLFGLSALLLSSPFDAVLTWIKENKKKVYTTGLLLNLLCAGYLFGFGPAFSLQEKFLLVALLVAQNISFLAEALLIKIEKEKKVFSANLVYLLFYGSAHFYFLYHPYSLPQLLGALVAATLVKCILLAVHCRKIMIPGTETPTAGIGRQWLYLGLIELLGIVVKWLDKWVVLFLLPVSQFAVYFNGSYEIPVFGLIATAIGSVILVELAKRPKGDAAAAKNVFERSSLFLASVVLPAFCFLFFYSDNFFHVIFGAKYNESIPIFKISILILPVRAIYSTAVLQVYHRADLIMKGAFMDLLLTIVLAFILYPFLQMRGLALSFVLSTYAQVGFYIWQTARIIQKPFWYIFPLGKMAVLLLLSFAVMGAGKFAFYGLDEKFQMIPGIVLSAALFFIFYNVFYRKSLETTDHM